jgi:hypothetical protein
MYVWVIFGVKNYKDKYIGLDLLGVVGLYNLRSENLVRYICC